MKIAFVGISRYNYPSGISALLERLGNHVVRYYEYEKFTSNVYNVYGYSDGKNTYYDVYLTILEKGAEKYFDKIVYVDRYIPNNFIHDKYDCVIKTFSENSIKKIPSLKQKIIKKYDISKTILKDYYILYDKDLLTSKYFETTLDSDLTELKEFLNR